MAKSKRYIDVVIKIAKGEVGYLEKKSNHDLNSKTKNAGSSNYTKYGEWYGMNGAYWCAMFISWIFNKAYGNCDLLHGKSASCEILRNRFRNHREYFVSPKKGDLIFFRGSRHPGANHIGIVTKVTGDCVYTIEGNTSSDRGVVDNGGAVNNKCYKRSYSRILGYGRPGYDKRLSTYGGAFPVLPSRGFFKKGDKGAQVKALQKFFLWDGIDIGKCGADGIYGPAMEKATLAWKKKTGLRPNDGNFGKGCLKNAKKYKRYA